MAKDNDISITSIEAWPEPSTKSYHEYKYDELVIEFQKEYIGPLDATFRSKLADFEDSIKELIAIE
jgi:hypothetical protein